MALSLSTFSKPLETKTVTLRGEAVILRALTASELTSLDIIYPEPSPPMKRDRSNTASTARTLDEFDPTYRQQIKERTYVLRAVEVGISAELKRKDDSSWNKGRDLNWIKGFANEILDTFTESELVYLWGEVRRIGLGGIVYDELIGGGNKQGN